MKTPIKLVLYMLVGSIMFCFSFASVCRAEGAALLRQTDLCNGKTESEKNNMRLVPDQPSSFIQAEGYFTLANKSQQYGSLTYRRDHTKEITVYAYTPIASFVSSQEGRIIRGYESTNLGTPKTRLRFNALDHTLFAIQENIAYYCVPENYTYAMKPGILHAPSDDPFYGLNIEYSSDGVRYTAARTDYVVTTRAVPTITYMERHTAQIPKEAQYIRLGVSLAARLRFGEIHHENASEDSLSIYRVEFTDYEASVPDVPPDSSSGSDNSPPPPEPPSSSSESSGEQTPVTPKPAAKSRRDTSTGGRGVRRDPGGPPVKEERGGTVRPHTATEKGAGRIKDEPEQSSLKDKKPTVVYRTIILDSGSSSSSSISFEEEDNHAESEPPQITPSAIEPETTFVVPNSDSLEDSESSFIWVYIVLLLGACAFLLFRIVKKK